jgi:nifR3 family TIM-barrel protein
MSATTKNLGFWAKLNRPIFALAPMHEVTDCVYRLLIAKHGKPDVMFTEFVSCDGLCSRGKENLLIHLRYDPSERPIVAQIFGKKPELFFKTAQLLQELGFDGIDINMGCPVKTIVSNGSCAALIKNPVLAKEIIEATKAGAGALPVSVKTRIGYSKETIEEWIPQVLEAQPAALTVHLRTAKEMSLVDAHWELMHKVAVIAKQHDTILLGNGDVKTIDQAKQLIADTGIDGVMLGRAIFGNPWLFNRERRPEEITPDERLDAICEHARLFAEMFGTERRFITMRKHLRSYATGFDGAKELRMQLEQVDMVEDALRYVDAFRQRTAVA